MTKNEQLKVKQFLNKKLALGKFLENIYNDSENSICEYFNITPYFFAFSRAFLWDETTEGYNYWTNLSVEFFQ